jgi:hypothetical protein
VRESEIESNVVASAGAAGWLTRKLRWTGRTGAPDRIFIKGGRVVFIEFKATGKVSRGEQSLECQRLRRAGAEVWVDVDSIDYGCRILKCLPIRGDHAAIG